MWAYDQAVLDLEPEERWSTGSDEDLAALVHRQLRGVAAIALLQRAHAAPACRAPARRCRAARARGGTASVEAVARDRLEQVVGRLHLERLDGVVVVRGGEAPTSGRCVIARSTPKPSMPGIWMSRKTRSGRCSSISCHRLRDRWRPRRSTSTSSSARRKPRSRSRASFSSSTTSATQARIRRWRAALRSRHRDAQRDGGAVAGPADDLRRVARHRRDAAAGRARCAGRRRARRSTASSRTPTPVSRDRQAQVALVDVRLDGHPAAADLRRDAVLHGVLDQRLQDQTRAAAGRARARRSSPRRVRRVAEAGALDLQIRLRRRCSSSASGTKSAWARCSR